MEPNEHPDYSMREDRAALVEQAAYYKREATRTEAELTALRERVAAVLEAADAPFNRLSPRLERALEALRGR